ncbi:hypothetical protein [Microbacterium paludicola]|uniref:hypothetical protein n=1 Tax=Microbacterium paludicola TaxID=300019 RepID=UPI00090327F6|nr:hypothetical protein [Microbacterium paludicola]APF33379.1 hypothetical protein BO218_03505 [Microbacterium paludicola]
MITFKTSVIRFKRSASDWLTEDDLPALVALEAIARKLDEDMTPQLLAQYGLTYRNLLARKPKAGADEDELEKALREAVAEQ